MFRAYGAKPAIGLAIAVTCLQLLLHAVFRLAISPFFLVASGFTVLLGSIDLLVASPRFFRLEPFAQNFVMGTVFLVTLFTRLPLVAWFAAALPEKVRPNLDEHGHHYLRKVTLVWVVYFYIKSLIFLYLAYQVDLGNLILLRSLIGGVSLVLMFVGEIIFRKFR